MIFMDSNKDFKTIKFMLTIKLGIYRKKGQTKYHTIRLA
jgi:hypothetical protein